MSCTPECKAILAAHDKERRRALAERDGYRNALLIVKDINRRILGRRRKGQDEAAETV